MTPTLTARTAGLGAVATFAGCVASLAWAAGAAHADDGNAAFNNDHERTACTIDRNDIQFAVVDEHGTAGAWTTADHFTRIAAEPVNGIAVRISNDSGKVADPSCTRTISLASYTAGGPTWETSALQGFVDVAHTTLNKNHVTDILKVKLPEGADGKPCFGQLDLYYGDTVFDGKTGAGHGPLPHYPDSTTPPPHDLIAAWNGGEDKCAETPPPPPTSTSPTSESPSTPTSTTSSPSTPGSTTPSSTPTTPAGSRPPSTTPPTSATPGTPTLAHTGASVAELSLIALAFFGAGGGALVASRRVSARRH